ncbi:MAG: hypothetical protein LBT47_06090 [Deltaproteobacteria bacterium]|jgi:hypothetical protein|nr:hypothetical protein [Deltaproteobacteria bacterium]
MLFAIFRTIIVVLIFVFQSQLLLAGMVTVINNGKSDIVFIGIAEPSIVDIKDNLITYNTIYPGKQMMVRYIGEPETYNLAVEYSDGKVEGYKNIPGNTKIIFLDATNKLQIDNKD